MVTHSQHFIIDATFIATKMRDTFLGANLLTTAGQDGTLAFGFLRELLRLRHRFAIHSGLVVVGSEPYSVCSRDRMHSVVASLERLKIPHIHNPLTSALNLTYSLRSHFSHTITADESFLQLTRQGMVVVFPRRGQDTEWDLITAEGVENRIGIAADHIPTFLALTDCLKASSKQAVRLIGSFGDLDNILRNLSRIEPVHTRAKLANCKATIRRFYIAKTIRRVDSEVENSIGECSLDRLNTTRNRRYLAKCGFRSLSILLPAPTQRPCYLNTNLPRHLSYHTVVDGNGLYQLRSLIHASTLCAIDVEADGKDPRTANPLGIAFCAKAGEAYFVPLTNMHLKDITKNDAIAIIKEMLRARIALIGHNIKYDILLLRRLGVQLGAVVFDTMLAAYDCHGDWPFFNLSYVCGRYLGARIKSYADAVDREDSFLDMPLATMVTHACQDADYALRLYPVLEDQLKRKRIWRQFLDVTMRELRWLVNLEFTGIAVDSNKLSRMRKHLVRRTECLNRSIRDTVGRAVDVRSQDDLNAIVAETAQLRNLVGARRVTVPTLEQIAVRAPLARHIVDLKRLYGRIARIDSLYANVRNGRVYPLFNQISSRVGLVTGRPNVFGSEGLPELKSSFERKARELFTEPVISLETLGRITKERLLEKRRSRRPGVGVSKVNLLMGVDQEDVLLRLAIEQSDSELARRFMTEQTTIARVRYDSETKHRRTFEWLKKFRRKALDNGYAANGRLRKYIDGLKSSDLGRREQATQHAVRWLVRY
jgi:hypothetical protein